MADQISDTVLDAILAADATGRVACETLVTTGLAIVAGEISTTAYVDIPNIVRGVIRDIGYDRAKYGFDAHTCGVMVSIDEQSADIAQGVDSALEERAGQVSDGDREAPITADLGRYLVEPPLALLPSLEHEGSRFLVTPTGRFEKGGPHADTGLTGRKIIVDTYGGFARHGGGAFSGKDPTKVDRSAAYAARHVAKTVVAAGLSARCEIQVAYALGVAPPLSVLLDCFATEQVH